MKIKCPVCGLEFEPTCEFVDIGIGYQQVTPNECPNGDWREGQSEEDDAQKV